MIYYVIHLINKLRFSNNYNKKLILTISRNVYRVMVYNKLQILLLVQCLYLSPGIFYISGKDAKSFHIKANAVNFKDMSKGLSKLTQYESWLYELKSEIGMRGKKSKINYNFFHSSVFLLERKKRKSKPIVTFFRYRIVY